jgi:hypothetical protein
LHAVKSRKEELKELDYGGLALYSAGLTLVILSFCRFLSVISFGLLINCLAWAESTYAWKSPHVLATLIIGVITLIAFFLWGKLLMQSKVLRLRCITEAFMPLKLPLLPIRLLKIRNYVVAIIVGSVGQMVYFSLNVLWPQQIAALYTTNNANIGWISVRVCG